jgi:hypothetical protein
MKYLLVLALVLSVVASAAADEAVVLIDGAQPASYLVTVASDGTIRVSAVRVAKPGESPSVKPNASPAPPAPTPFEQLVTELTRQVMAAGGSKDSAEKLSGVYASVARQVASDAVVPAQAADALRSGSDAALAGAADAAHWGSFRGGLTRALTTLKTQGHLETKEQLAAVFQEIARGIAAAAR